MKTVLLWHENIKTDKMNRKLKGPRSKGRPLTGYNL